MPAPPCKLLIGPLFNPDLIGAYAGHEDIKLFMPASAYTDNYRYDLVYDPEKIRHFNEILNGLPAGWEPDLLLWWDPVYQPLPPGIEDCPYPTALIPGDWNLAFLSVLQSARCFDAVFADARLGPILAQAGSPKICPWPGFAYDARQIYRETPELERIHDVCFIGNMNPSIHPRRSRYLAQVLKLQDRYQLFLRQGVWGDDYRRALNQSRIVLNYTICQVMNMRAYEAPACGALLFIEADNCEVRDVFTDGVSCVLYDDENLLEKLEYYLEHEDERARIAAAGWQIVQAYSYERHFERLLAQIPDLLAGLPADLAQRRPALAQSPARRRLLALNQMAGSNRYGAALAALYLEEQRSLLTAGVTQAQLWELNAVLVMLFPHLDENQKLFPVYNISLQDLRGGFEAALQLDPEHPVLHYHFALVSEYLAQDDQALWSYSRSIELMAAGQLASLEAYRDFILPFNKTGRGTDQSVFEWERVSYECIEQGLSPDSGYMHLLSSSIWQRIARILIRQHRHDKALIAYQNAWQNFPRASLLLAICQLYQVLNQSEDMLQEFTHMLEVQPLMVKHLPELLTPDLLIRHADEIQAWSRHYRPLYPELDKPGQLAGLIQWARSGQTQNWDWQSLLNLPLSPDLYQALCMILQRFESNAALKPLQVLRQPWPLSWHLNSEIPPELEAGCGFFWSQQSDAFSLGESHSDLQRVYDQPSEIAKSLCGPDRFPFLYQLRAEASQTLNDLLEGLSQVIVAVLEAWTPAQIRQLLQHFENNWAHDPQTLLLLWSPPGSSFSLGDLEAVLPEDPQAQFAWFDERLSLPEQADLLARSQLVLASPRAKGLFYSYWAKSLGVPAAWICAPDWLPEPAQTAFSLPVYETPAAALDHFRSGRNFHPAADLPEFWRKPEARAQAWLNGLWQLRLTSQLSSEFPG